MPDGSLRVVEAVWRRRIAETGGTADADLCEGLVYAGWVAEAAFQYDFLGELGLEVATCIAGWLHEVTGQTAEARYRYEQAFARGYGDAAIDLVRLEAHAEDIDRARYWMEHAQRIGVPEAAGDLEDVAVVAGDSASNRAFFEEITTRSSTDGAAGADAAWDLACLYIAAGHIDRGEELAREAALAGCAEAMMSCLEGAIEDADLESADRWFGLLREMGDEAALRKTGPGLMRLASAALVMEDLETAGTWIERAELVGDDDIRVSLQQLAPRVEALQAAVAAQETLRSLVAGTLDEVSMTDPVVRYESALRDIAMAEGREGLSPDQERDLVGFAVVSAIRGGASEQSAIASAAERFEMKPVTVAAILRRRRASQTDQKEG